MLNIKKITKRKDDHKYCLFHFYCQKNKNERFREPYFNDLAKVFWIVNSLIVVINFSLVFKWYMFFSKYHMFNPIKELLILPYISLLVVGILGILYRYPQYSNVPYSLLLNELPKNRQRELRYAFQQLIVTSAGYLAVLFLTVSINIVSYYLGVRSVIFTYIYAILLILIILKHYFVCWFINATKK